jgi:D-tyrosyl-tRNA(Tyr) deacylase
MDRGLLVYLGIAGDDSEEGVRYLADKIPHLRIYEDGQGKMNRSVIDEGRDICVVSQFTLYGDLRKGRRPSYNRAAPPEAAEPLYRDFVARLESHGVRVHEGA